MNSDPARIESIVAAAVAKPAEERAAFLDKACGGDAELRRRVEALLLVHPNAGSAPITTDLPAGQWIDRDAQPSVTEGPGTRVGRFKLLQQIGEGGMGTVYMAEQEKPVRRRVALKIIKPGMDSAQVIARFEVERQALAMMDHPNIAKVLDAGTTESGRPYFVMELVYGVPITKFCDDSQLTPRQRLELFVPVCQAIQHAHQKGIIHRDIKPSNVLVTMHDDKPVPKVIDFGVAKATEQHLTEKTLFTAFGTVVGTYEYMSPEQAEMNAFGVDTRSDVYSLGVLLYELLTGSTPLERKRLREAAFSEMVRLIKEEEPPRPSVRLSSSGDLPKIAAARKTDPGRLPSLLRGEIDWIVMRCLEKDRTRRYESASALARDVERYLNDEAVEACPPSVGYRLRKFARKFRVALVTAAAFAAVLMIASGVSIWLAIAARQAEAIANDRSEEAEKEKQNAANQRDRAERESQRAEKAAKEAKENAAQTGRLLDRMTVAKGLQLAEEGKMFEALPWFVRPLERSGLTPEEEKVHRTRIACYLRHSPGRPVLRQVLFPVGPVSHAAWSKDAKRVLTVSDKIVQVWDVRSGETLATLQHSEPVAKAQFTPDGTCVLTASGLAVWHWDARNGRQLGPPLMNWEALLQQSLSPLPQTPLQLLGNVGAQQLAAAELKVSTEISHDGHRALFTYGRHMRLMDLQSRKAIGQWLRGTEWMSNRRTMFFSDHALGPNGQLLLLNRDGLVNVFATVDGMKSGRLIDHGSPVASVAFSPDGTRALTVGKDSSLQVWDAKIWRPLARLSGHDSEARQYAGFSPDNRYVPVWEWNRDLVLWDWASGRLVHVMPVRDRFVLRFAWKPDSWQFLCNSGHGDVELWDVSESARPAAILPHGSELPRAFYGPDARKLLTATDGEVRIWDISGGNQLFALKPLEKDAAGTSMLLVVPFGDNGLMLPGAINASEMGSFFPDQEEIKRFLPPGTRFLYAVLSPERSRVLTSHLEADKFDGAQGNLQLWDAKSRRRLGKSLGSTSFSCAAFSKDSRLIVAAGGETVYLFDARTGTVAGHPLKHGSGVLYAGFSPDSEMLVTCGQDKSARLWQTRTGQPVGEKLEHEGWVALAAFSANGKIVATASMDGVIHLWDNRGASLGMLKSKSGHPHGLLFHASGLLLVAFPGDKMRMWDVASQQEVSPVMAGLSNKSGLYIWPPGTIEIEGGMLVRNRDFDPPSDARPVGDLVKLSQLYSGRHLDATGTVALLRTEEWQILWRDLHLRCPEEFVSPKADVEWRIRQLLTAAYTNRPDLIAFHRRWLADELAETGWQPGVIGNEGMRRDNYLQRITALAVHGRHAEAAAAADELAARWPKDQTTLYDCACVPALAAGAVKNDATLAERYAARAVALLQQAVAAGYNNGTHMLKDSDLDALRQRNDFQMLLKKLDTKQP